MTPVADPIVQSLDECAREPISIPGKIQSHGFLLTLDSQGRVAQASANAAVAFGIPLTEIQGSELAELLGEVNALTLQSIHVEGHDTLPEYSLYFQAPDGVTYETITHRRNGIVIAEFERSIKANVAKSSNTFGLVQQFMSKIAPASTLESMNFGAACEVRKLTGFDRVMIYRFDADANGTVVSEDRNDELPSYLDLRFPASDIPAQARELYRINRLRLIPDVNFSPSPIEPALHPETGQPLDLTNSVLRSVSPVHVQYMKNMGTGASMSISILRDGQLWGLIACHNKLPRYVPFEVRNACDIIAQVLSAQLSSADYQSDIDRRLTLKSNQTKLLTYMAEENHVLEGLARNPEDLFACTNSLGAAILFEGECRRFGVTPTEAQIRDLATWLGQRDSDDSLFATDRLAVTYKPAEQFTAVASGVIAASISSLHNNFLMWFRPELVRTVTWGGDPTETKGFDDAGRLTPRSSFRLWKEQVRGRSLSWSENEIDCAADLRQIIIRIVLRKAEELAQISNDLQRSNQELETFSYSVSHDLRAPFRHIVGFAELLNESESSKLSDTGRRYLSTIIESAQFAGTLVDNLLRFSQLGRASLNYIAIDSRKLVDEVVEVLLRDEPDRSIEWRIGPLPVIQGDLFMLRLVFQNLISNACKYSRPRASAVIEITAARSGSQTAFTIRDNGVGFEAQYSDKLFEIFQRLHKPEEFEGTGIGLANVKRIVTRHGGRVWAEGAKSWGAAFSFSLPNMPERDDAK